MEHEMKQLFIFVIVSAYLRAYAHREEAGKTNESIFECNKEFCNNIVCEAIEDCSEGLIVSNRSYCGCCDVCLKFSGKGEPCRENRPILGEVLLHECQQGFQCLDGICVQSESEDSCLFVTEFRETQKLQNDYPYAKDLWLPSCNLDGNYATQQQKKRKNICVDEKGKRIHGQQEQDLSRKAACDCSRHMSNLEKENSEDFITKPQEHCTSTGDYDDIQCIGNTCYCADNTTGEIIGRVTKAAYIHLLPCYTEKNDDHPYLGRCETQLIRSRSLRREFHQKSIQIVGLEFVNCDYDGTYSFKQCDSSRCVCTDENGNGIKSYHPEKTREIELLMECNCARDEHSREAFHARYPRMNCDVMGNFQHLQCFGEDHCYCVDEDGDVISEQRKNLTEDYCRSMLRSLNGDPVEVSTPGTTTTEDDYSDEYSDEYER